MHSKRYSEEIREEVFILYTKELWSVAQISRKRGMPTDPKTIRRWLKERGVDLRSPADLRSYPRTKILKDLNAGVARRKIQEKYGCSAKYLSLLAGGELEP